MSHRLYDITLYYYPEGPEARRFTLMQNIVSDLYVQFLDGYKPPKTSRISVRLAEADDPGRHFGSILSPTAEFDKERYWKLDAAAQKRMILDTVHRIARLCAAHFDWSIDPFNKAYQEVLDANFEYCLESKPKASRDRKHSATVRLQKNESHAIISAVFRDRDGKEKRVVELLRSFQHPMFYGELMRGYKWFNNHEFGLFTPGEEITIKASLDSDTATTTITPQDTPREHLEGQLRRATHRVFDTEEERIRWINQ
jgi:hypothetical protein